MIKEQKRLQKQLIMKYFILFAIVALVAIRNIYSIGQQKIGEDSEAESTSANQLITTDTQLTEDRPSLPNNDALLKQAILNKASENDGRGTAIISMSDNFFIHQINLETKEPGQDNIYQAWIYKEKPKKEYFPLGQLHNKDGNYQISYVSELNRIDFTKIFISEESQDDELGSKPTKVLFEGNFENIE